MDRPSPTVTQTTTETHVLTHAHLVEAVLAYINRESGQVNISADCSWEAEGLDRFYATVTVTNEGRP